MTYEISLQHGACFLLVTVPAKFQVEKEYFDRAMSKYLRKAPDLKIDLEKPDNILRSFCEENKIHFLSLLKGFREHYVEKNKKLYHSIEDGHWNTQGHELASEIVSDYLITKKIL